MVKNLKDLAKCIGGIETKAHNVLVPKVVSRMGLLAVAVSPFIVAFAQQGEQKAEPLAEQVFKDVKVFKGVPASDMIPAMQFMSAAMNYSCADCHDPKDYAAPNKNKEETRRMILLQRDINDKHFGGRLEVTCMTCHNKEEHPNGMPLPDGISRRHQRINPAPKPADLVTKYFEVTGKKEGVLIRTGTLTAPNDETYEMESVALELIQAPEGKYRIVSGERKITSDGKHTWYGKDPIADEPAALFGRIGRAWRSDQDFQGLTRLAVTGKANVSGQDATVVQGYRAATVAAEELYFDNKSNLLTRLVNFRRSTVGTVVSAIDYTDYKAVDGIQVPMKITITMAEGHQWVMEFKEAKIQATIDDKTFIVGG